MQTLSYLIVEEVLVDHQASTGAAEAHGVLTGLLVVNPAVSKEQWIAQIFEEEAAESFEFEYSPLAEVFDATTEALADSDYVFDLLLPDEDEPIAKRILALREWCQGFLYGIGANWEEREWSEESREVLQDLAEITRLDEETDAETAEEDLAEISEFVRVAVQLVRSEVLDSKAAIPQQIH